MLVIMLLMLQLTPWATCCPMDGAVVMDMSEGTPVGAEWRLIHNEVMTLPVAYGLNVERLPIPCGQTTIHTRVEYLHQFLIFEDGFDDGAETWLKPSPRYYRTKTSTVTCEGEPHA